MILNLTYASVTSASKVLIMCSGVISFNARYVNTALSYFISYSGPKAIRAVETSEEKKYLTRHAI